MVASVTLLGLGDDCGHGSGLPGGGRTCSAESITLALTACLASSSDSCKSAPSTPDDQLNFGPTSVPQFDTFKSQWTPHFQVAVSICIMIVHSLLLGQTLSKFSLSKIMTLQSNGQADQHSKGHQCCKCHHLLQSVHYRVIALVPDVNKDEIIFN